MREQAEPAGLADPDAEAAESWAAGAEPEDEDVRSHTTSGRANLELLFVGLGALVVSLSRRRSHSAPRSWRSAGRSASC
jgi:hypothetical protein